VFQFVRIAFIICVLPLAGFAKDIRLRNELIHTPDKSDKTQAAAGAQTAEAAADGLFLIQFTKPINDAQREQLRAANVELLQSVPEDAFVARFNHASARAVRALPFVHWVGTFKPEHKIHPKLAGMTEKRPVSFLIAPNSPAGEVALLKKRIPGLVNGRTTSAGTVVHGVVNPNQLNAIAQSHAVLWIEPAAKPKLHDEVASEIIEGELDGAGAYVPSLGFDGKGVVVSVADSGLMEGTVANMHPDLAGRVDAFFYYGQLTDAADEHGHGTHVSGIVAGNGASGETDDSGLLYGLGTAPGAHLIAQRIFDGVGGFEAPESNEQLTRNAVQAGAVVGSNSWGDDTQGQYDLNAMEFDALVRDADADTPGDQPYILEFSAGNAGPGEQTIGSPAVGKNVIATGASENNRFDFIIYADGQDAMADFSSRGPCADGRIKPDIVAPGTWISSLQSSAATDENAWLGISPLYQYEGGTSQAGPHVSGAAAVFVQYYRETHNGKTPSPALVKAALINSADDMDDEAGTGPIPNNDEGWGRVDLTQLIGSAKNYEFVDQTDTLAQDQVYEKHFYVADDSQPLRFTLVYTDVPGAPEAIQALVNDLDLEVTSPDGVLYAGNQMLGGESAPQPAGRDSLNNVECVYLNAPVAGEYIVRVRAKRINQDARKDTAATDQDFALVVSGSLPAAGHSVIAFDRRAYSAPATIGLKLIDFDLAGQAEAVVTLSSTTETSPITVHMLPSGSSGVFTGFVATATGPAANDDKLQVKHGDTITAQYHDASPAETVTATRPVDLLPPVISNVGATNRFGNELVSWSTDELAAGIVWYGTNGSLSQSITNASFRTGQAISLTNLVVGQTYQYIVIAFDQAGNRSTNDNNGQKFSFVAQPVATVLLVDSYFHDTTGSDDTAPIPLTSYTDALDATGVSYEVWSVANDGAPTLQNLSPYRVVIWRVDDSFYKTGASDSTLSLSQQTMIETYLKHDGSFLLASMEILARLGETEFRTNVLGDGEFKTPDPNDPFADCPDCDQDHGMPVLEGLPGDSIGAGVRLTMDYSEYPTLVLDPIAPDVGPDVSDTFTPTTNAVPIFVDEASGRVTGVRLPRNGSKSSGRVVFLGFPLDGIPMTGASPNNRVTILRNILAYLAPGVNGLGTLSFDRGAYTIPDRMTIQIADSDLAGKGTATAHVFSTTDTTGITLTLTETPQHGVFEGIVTLVPATATPKTAELRVADGDSVIAEYVDQSANSTVSIRCGVDATAPAISGTTATVDYEYAVIDWSTDEPADALVQYGESAFLGRTAYRSTAELDHELTLNNLQPGHTYYYQVVSRDPAGNTVIDDNGGKLYTFKTLLPKSLPWSDDMEGSATEWTVETTEDSELQWELGAPANGIVTSAHSGTKCWGSNLQGVMGTYTETALISPAFLLGGGNRATLTFWQAYDFTVDASYEAASLQIVTNSQANAVTLAQYDGASGTWEQAEVDLTPYIGKVVQLVWFYQLLDVDEATEPHRGWLVDDVAVSMTTETRGSLVVHANLSQATYTIDGPSPATGQGFAYTNNAALSGTYTVTFDPVPNYNTPAPKTVTVPAGGSVVIDDRKYDFPDVNHNGISDQWETTFFGGASAPHDGTIDSDGDGASDFAEFMAGTSPTDPTSVLKFATPTVLTDGRVQLSWPATPGYSYRVLGSTDAHTWTVFVDWVRSNTTVLVHTLPQLPPAEGYFFQIQVMP
jgi:hypothetical protein